MDITVHEVNASDGHILELDCPSGGLFGGIHVDKEFEDLMNGAFGTSFMRKFKDDFPNDWQTIMNRFETHKRAEEDVDNDEISIPLPLNFWRSCSHDIGDGDDINRRISRFYANKLSVGSDYLNISMEMLSKLYQPIVSKIADHVKNLLARSTLKDVKTIFLVGGFSEAQFLRKEISRRFSDKRILIPYNPELAIIHGAVEFAQDPSLLQARIMGKTYGVNVLQNFDPARHPLDKKVVRCNKEYCKDVLRTLVKKTERIDIMEKRSYSFSPVDPEQTSVAFQIFSTNQEKAEFVTDPGVESENVEVEVATPDTTKGCDRVIRMDVMFGGTELKVDVTDVESGNVSKASVRLVSKPGFHSRFH